MRVLHLISSGGMYGAEAVILNLARVCSAGAEHTAVVGVFAPGTGPAPTLYTEALRNGVEAYLVRCDAQMDRAVPRRLRELVERTGADVLHAHGYKADVYSFLAFRGMNAALVSTCHTWYDNDLALRAYGMLDRFVLRRFAGVVAVSPEVRGQLLGAGVAASRVRLIRNGVALDVFEEATAERERRRSNGEPLRVGLVGRFAPEKGIDVFLEAVSRVAKSFAKVQFVIAGDGPDRASLEGQRERLGLIETVEMPGEQRDMPRFYVSLDLLVSASRQEGLPVALLEGMASGLPVVATRVGAVPEAVLDGETGLLVRPEAPDELASAMEGMLHSTEVRDRFGAAGQRRVREQFSANRMTDDYLALYREVCAGTKSPVSSRTVAHGRS